MANYHHDNEYLHYQDDWYIVDYEYDDNPSGVPAFALVLKMAAAQAWPTPWNMPANRTPQMRW